MTDTTSMIPALNLDDLAKIARSASLGNWKQTLSATGNRATISSELQSLVAENLAPVDAEYLVTFQPHLILHLLSTTKDALEEAERLRAELDKTIPF